MGESEDSCGVYSFLFCHSFCRNCDRDADDERESDKEIHLWSFAWELLLLGDLLYRDLQKWR